MDEDNFPSLANSPTPSPRAATNGPAQSNSSSGAEEGDPSAAGKELPSLKGLPTRVPSAWGAVEGPAHKAATPEKKSNELGKAESMSSQQKTKTQAASSKLQPGAASFKAKNKHTGSGKIPWVETGMASVVSTLRVHDNRVVIG